MNSVHQVVDACHFSQPLAGNLDLARGLTGKAEATRGLPHATFRFAKMMNYNGSKKQDSRNYCC